MHAACRRRSARRQQTIDERGGHAVRCGGKQGAARRGAHESVDFFESCEFQLGIGAAQVWERAGDRSTGLTIRENGGDGQLRMTRDQPKQFAGDIAGAAQHDRGSGTAHSPATLDSRAFWRPNRAMR